MKGVVVILVAMLLALVGKVEARSVEYDYDGHKVQEIKTIGIFHKGGQ